MIDNEPKTDVTVELTNQDGNVFAIIGKVSTLLKRAGYSDLADEFRSRAMKSYSYDDVLALVQNYVHVD